VRSVVTDASVFVPFFVERNKARFPGMQIVGDCPWRRVLDLWPEPLSGLTDRDRGPRLQQPLRRGHELRPQALEQARNVRPRRVL